MVQTARSGVWQPRLGAKGDVAWAGGTHPSRALLALGVHGRSLPGQGTCFPRTQPHSEGRLGTEAPQPLKPRDLAPWCPLALKNAVPERLPGWDVDRAQAGASPVAAATSSPHLAPCRVPARLRIWAGSWRGPCPVHSFVAGHAEGRWRLSRPVAMRQASRSPGQTVGLPTPFCFPSNGTPTSLRGGGLAPVPRTTLSAVAPPGLQIPASGRVRASSPESLLTGTPTPP